MVYFLDSFEAWGINGDFKVIGKEEDDADVALS